MTPPIPTPSGPSQPTRSLRAFCPFLLLDCLREKKKKKLDLHVQRIFMIFSPLALPSLFVLTAPRPFSKQNQQAVNTDQHQSPRWPPKKYFLEYSGVGMVLGPLSDKQPVLCSATSRAPSLAPTTPSVCLQGPPAGGKPLSESTLATWPCPAKTSSLPAMVWVPAPTRPLDPSSCMRDSRCRLLEDTFIALCPAGARVAHGTVAEHRASSGAASHQRLDGHISPSRRPSLVFTLHSP